MEYKSYDKMSKQTKELLSIVPGSPIGAQVVDGDLSYAIRVWKRSLKNDGRLKEIYERQEYVKPSARRRKTKQTAIYRQRMNLNETD